MIAEPTPLPGDDGAWLDEDQNIPLRDLRRFDNPGTHR